MYKLSRFFVSDIIAGSNIVRNAHFPIMNKDENSDHGIIVASNGVGKTTLLSFVFSVFCPDQRSFVQHIQSEGDKKMEQYLIPGRPAIVLLDIVTKEDSSLFEEEPWNHIVVGQIFYKRKSNPSVIERTSFIVYESEFIDTIAEKWNDLIDNEKPYQSVKDFIFPKVYKFSSHREWEEKLNQLSLDPWLINRQIDFAKREGGIKDAFKFKQESDFLSFFLGCVIDIDYAAKIRTRVIESTEKMKGRPRKRAELESVRTIIEKLESFNIEGKNWRLLNNEIEENNHKLGQAFYLLNQGIEKSDKEYFEKSRDIEADKKEQYRLKKERDKNLVNQKAASSQLLNCEVIELENNLNQIMDQLSSFEKEKNSLKAAGLKSKLNKLRAETENLEKILKTTDKELDKERELENKRAFQYHKRLEKEINDIRSEIDNLKKDKIDADKEKKSLNNEIKSLRREKEESRISLKTIQDKKENAEKELKDLDLYEGETTNEAEIRLKSNLGRVVSGLEEIKISIKSERENAQLKRKENEDLSRSLRDNEYSLKDIDNKISDEEDHRKEVLNDINIASFMGNRNFDPFAEEITQKIESAVKRKEEQTDDLRLKIHSKAKELEELETKESAASDPHVKDLISYYVEKGISEIQLKSFPEYLSGINDDPEITALYLKNDPGRFTGIMCGKESVLEKIKKLPVPKWLSKPVVISLPPSSLSEVSTIDHHVITPEDSFIYSKKYLEEKKLELIHEIKGIKEEKEKELKRLESLKKSESRLKDYKEKYLGENSIESLSRLRDVAKKRVKEIEEEIRKNRETLLSIDENLESLENKKENLHEEKSVIETSLGLIRIWIKNYKDLNILGKELDQALKKTSDLENSLLSKEEEENSLFERNEKIIADISVKETEYNNFSGKRSKIKKPDNSYSPGDDVLKEALSLDLETIEELFFKASRLKMEKATELGIQSLEEKLEDFRKEYSKYEYEFKDFTDRKTYDEDLLEYWVSKDEKDRSIRFDELDGNVNQANQIKGACESNLEVKINEYKSCLRELDDLKREGLSPDIEIPENDKDKIEEIINNLKSDEEKISGNFEENKKKIFKIEDALTRIRDWISELKILAAGIENYKSYSGETDINWPDLLEKRDRKQSIEEFKKILDEIKNKAEKSIKNREKVKKNLNKSFDKFQNDLMDERFLKRLPVITGELRNYDLESLGEQSESLIKRCDNIAENIESDLQRTEEFMQSLIKMMLDHAKECSRKINSATKINMPDSVFIHGGKPILKSAYRLDFNKHEDDFIKTIDSWFHELIEEGRIPEVNSKAGNNLGAELLYRLLMAEKGKKEFNIRLLKCDDSGKNYEPVGKDLGSGGEALTTAVLLYSLLTYMRQERKGNKNDKIPAFLISDNPLGVCNRSDFLDAQLKMADSLGIQCIYFTGIHDAESLGLFEHRIAVRKGERKCEVGNNIYNLLEVVEQNLETQNG